MNNRFESIKKTNKRNIDDGYRRSNGILGYTSASDGSKVFCIVEAEAYTVRKVFNLFLNEHLSFQKIADIINKDVRCKPKFYSKTKSKFTAIHISRILHRPEYCQKTETSVKGKYLYSPYYPEIIDEEQWNKVHDLLNKKTTKSKVNTMDTDFVLLGKLSCKKCHQNYTRKGKYYYHKYQKNSTCTNSSNYIKKVEIEKYARTFIENILTDTYARAYVQLCIEKNYRQLESESYLNLQKQICIIDEQLQKLQHTNRNCLINDFNEQKALLTDHLYIKRTTVRSIDSLCRDYLSNIRTNRKVLLECINIFIHRITVINDKLYIESYHYFPTNLKHLKISTSNLENQTLKLQNNTEYLKKGLEKSRIEYYLKTMTSPISESIKELDDYRLYLYRLHANNEKEPFKTYLPTYYFADINNTNIIISTRSVYQWSLSGPFYIDYPKNNTPCEIMQKENDILSIKIEQHYYFNMDYIHRIPECFNNGSNEYFNADQGLFSFILEGNRIVVKNTCNGIGGNIIDFSIAIHKIMISNSYSYIC